MSSPLPCRICSSAAQLILIDLGRPGDLIKTGTQLKLKRGRIKNELTRLADDPVQAGGSSCDQAPAEARSRIAVA